MLNQETKQKIIHHYDLVSPYYEKLWGKHIHHRYYLTGKESKEEATENLIKLIVNKAKIKKKSKILDIGCGIGGTSLWLAKNLNCNVTGITISPIQVEIAQKISSKSKIKNPPKFFVQDANDLKIKEKFDVLYAVEMISHLEKRKEFFKRCARLLDEDGKFCIADWFKKDRITELEEKEYIKPINERMMVSLWYSKDYITELEKNGLKLKYHEDISQNVKKTWDLCLDIIKRKDFWTLAFKHGKEFVDFLKAFQNMKNGFESGNLRYEILVFEKTSKNKG